MYLILTMILNIKYSYRWGNLVSENEICHGYVGREYGSTCHFSTVNQKVEVCDFLHSKHVLRDKMLFSVFLEAI